MAVNPDTGKIEMLHRFLGARVRAGRPVFTFGHSVNPLGLLRPNGEPVPAHWSVFTVGQLVEVEGCTMRVAHINESGVLLEPVSPVVGDAPHQ